MDDANPEAEAVAVVGNKIVYVGSAAGASAIRTDRNSLIKVKLAEICGSFA